MPGRLETCLLLALATVSGFAAEDAPAIKAGPVYIESTTFPEVRVMVALPPGPVPGAPLPAPMTEASTFSLRMDNGPASPATVRQTLADTGRGIAALAMLDASGSMAGAPLNAIRAGLVKFTSEMIPGDQVAICTVADETKWDSNWGDPKPKLDAALTGLRPRGSLTRLWDGMIEILARYPTDPPEGPLVRRLVVISDGHDEGSHHTLDEVIAAALAQHVVVDSIGMTRSDPKYQAELGRLSTATGGLHQRAVGLTALEKIVGGGIKLYRNFSVVTFKPEGLLADGKSHSFQVTWNGTGKDLQSTVDAVVPDDPKVSLPAPSAEPAKTVPAPPPPPAPETSGTPPQAGTLERIPKQWLYVGGGVLAVALLALIAGLALRKKKPSPAPYEPQQPPPQPIAFNTGAFGQTPHPFDPAPPANSPVGSVYMQLPPEVPAARPPQPTRLASWFPSPSKERPSGWLMCVAGDAVGKSFPIDQGEYWIGANANNQLPLPDDPTVSGNHACIIYENSGLALFDHRSTNGIFVNDERLNDSKKVLQAGDRLRVGKSVFVLKPNDAA